jgi:SSS family solute:Na+ symporter
MAVSISGILRTLLAGLTLTTAYTLITLMTIFFPQVCRRSHATWTLLMAMVALVAWFVIPQLPTLFANLGLPHPIYFCWIVSLVTFFIVFLFDKRRIRAPNLLQGPQPS